MSAGYPDRSPDAPACSPADFETSWGRLAARLADAGDDDLTIAEDLARIACQVADGRSRPPTYIGRYRIEREVGRGGQGRVFRALDESLGRPVAVKILPAIADRREEARLRREGEIAARLDDPRVCKVFEVGECDAGTYIAMQYVAGVSLARRIALHEGSGPVTLRDPPPIGAQQRVDAILGYVEAALLAVADMHDAGVVHRDLKPGNLMVVEDGQPMILDFGLARSEALDLHTLTVDGDAFGTPAYMAPELLGDEPVRPHPGIDVWSMGVILWELLTGSRPFVAPSRMALAERIRTAPLPPLRRLLRAAPPELAVVAEVALERDPARRYASARAFVADIAAIRALRPIAARRVGRLLRARRAVQRRPLTWTIAVFAAILLTVTPTAFAVQASLDNHRIRSERARAENMAAVSMQAVEEMLIGFGRSLAAQLPGEVPLREWIFERAGGLLERIEAGPELSTRLLTHAATVRYELTRLAPSDSDPEEVIRRSERTLDLLTRLVTRSSGEARLRARQMSAHVHILLASASRSAGRTGVAERHLQRAEDLLPANDADRWRAEVASARADIHWQKGRVDESREAFRRATDSYRAALAVESDDSDACRIGLAEALMHLALFDRRDERWDTAQAQLAEAVDGLEPITADRLQVRARVVLSKAYLLRAQTLRQSGDSEAAFDQVRRAVEICEDLAGLYPDTWDFQESLATALAELATIAPTVDRPDVRLDAAERASRILDALRERSPTVDDTSFQYCYVANKLGEAFDIAGARDPERAAIAFRRCLEAIRSTDALPDRHDRVLELALSAGWRLARIHAERGDNEAARRLLDEAERRFGSAGPAAEVPWTLRQGCFVARLRARRIRDGGDTEAADLAFDRAIQRARKLTGVDQTPADRRRAYGIWRERILMWLAAGDWERAIDAIEASMPAFHAHLDAIEVDERLRRFSQHPAWTETAPLMEAASGVSTWSRLRFATQVLALRRTLYASGLERDRSFRKWQLRYRWRAFEILRAIRAEWLPWWPPS